MIINPSQDIRVKMSIYIIDVKPQWKSGYKSRCQETRHIFVKLQWKSRYMSRYQSEDDNTYFL